MLWIITSQSFHASVASFKITTNIARQATRPFYHSLIWTSKNKLGKYCFRMFRRIHARNPNTFREVQEGKSACHLSKPQNHNSERELSILTPKSTPKSKPKKLKEMFILAKSVLIVLKSVVEILFDLLKVWEVLKGVPEFWEIWPFRSTEVSYLFFYFKTFMKRQFLAIFIEMRITQPLWLNIWGLGPFLFK